MKFELAPKLSVSQIRTNPPSSMTSPFKDLNAVDPLITIVDAGLNKFERRLESTEDQVRGCVERLGARMADLEMSLCVAENYAVLALDPRYGQYVAKLIKLTKEVEDIVNSTNVSFVAGGEILSSGGGGAR